MLKNKIYDQKANPGQAFIFNNQHFDKQSPRDGSEKDVQALARLFTEMDFAYLVHTDLTVAQFHETLTSIEKKDFSAVGSLVMVFLSHGDDGVIWMKDGTYKVDNIMTKFYGKNCPTLIGQPKLFIFQACRGHKIEGPSDLMTDELEDIEEDGVDLKAIPGSSDMLVCTSTNKGFVSFRNIITGSIYIQHLVKVVQEYFDGKVEDGSDFIRLLTMVSYQVAEWSAKFNGTTAKQMPTFTSTFRKLYFLPKK